MEKFKLTDKKQITKLPKRAGVYAFKANGKFLYIGKAVNLKARIKQHQKLIALADKIAYIVTDSEIEALLLEAKLIKKHQPKYNVAWRDDKNYFYVGITQEEFPRIFITHQTKQKAKYIGPFVKGKSLKEALKNLRKTYPYRTCRIIPSKPCLWYHLGQCPAPCIFKSPRIEAYDVANIQGESATGAMVTFINGKPDKNLYRRFKIHPVKCRSAAISPKAKLFNRVETTEKPNDVAMLKQVLSRRFRHPEWGRPDLILIDGGKAQLNAAKSVTKTPAVALAKKKNELYMEWKKEPVLLKNLPRETANLLLRMRDEAHRFARSYHHLLRKKALFR